MCDDIRMGGSGYNLTGKLPDEVEHMRPDYSLYGITDTAYGFLSRGCPRGCPFCVVARKEGRESRKVCDLSEWWNGQKNITLMDPNITACPDCLDLLGQLADSRAVVDISQGVDIRLLNDEKVQALNRLRLSSLHFAWDGHEDLEPVFRKWSPFLRKGKSLRMVYVLVNFNTSKDWDLHRIYTLRSLGFDPYVMIFEKHIADKWYHRLQRWVNNKFIFYKCDKFEDYK